LRFSSTGGIRWSGAALLLCLFAVGCATMPFANLRLIVTQGKPFIVAHTDKAEGWGKATHPYLCRIGSNRIMATYWVAGDGANQSISTVDWPAYSDDDGVTWKYGDPFNWITGPPTNFATAIKKGEPFKYNLGYCFGSLVTRSGQIIAQDWAIGTAKSGELIGHAISSGDGVNWKGPFVVRYDVPTNTFASCYLSSRAVELQDGSIVTVGYMNRLGEKGYSTFCFGSTDGGQSYSLLSIVAGPGDSPWGYEVFGAAGPCEPAVELLPDGSLICLMRTGSLYGKDSTRMLIARSSDGGRTWKREKCPFPGVMPKLLRMSNGVLVCAFGRPGNNLIFSLDNGRTWGHERAVTPADIRTTGYLDIIETEPGRLFVIYDAFNYSLSQVWLWEPTASMNGIFGVFVDVKRW